MKTRFLIALAVATVVGTRTIAAPLPSGAGNGTIDDQIRTEPCHKGKVLSEWIRMLHATDPDLRWDAMEALATIGPAAKAAVPALVAVFQRDPETRNRYAAGLTLGWMNAPAVVIPVLIEGLKAKELSVRRGAAYALGAIGPDAKAAIPALCEILARHPDYVHPSLSSDEDRLCAWVTVALKKIRREK